MPFTNPVNKINGFFESKRQINIWSVKMEEEIPEYEEFCGECGEKTRKKFVERR